MSVGAAPPPQCPSSGQVQGQAASGDASPPLQPTGRSEATGTGEQGRWLFNERLYLARYPDLTPEALAAGGYASGFDHYSRAGDREGRSGHLLFDPAWYLEQLPPDEAAKAKAEGAFAHYHRRIANAEAAPSAYFDPAWYRHRYGGAMREGASSLRHYLENDTPAAFDPLAAFSEQFYLVRYPDVRAAVDAGKFRNGYHHFLTHGVVERRSPTEGIDLDWYVDSNKAVAADLATGRVRDALVHYLTIGRAEGLATAPPKRALPGEVEGAALFRLRARALLPGLARRGLDFTCGGTPEVSVVIATHDRFAQLMASLAALRAGFAGAIELMLVDLGSDDETALIERFVAGAQVLRFDDVSQSLAARNAAIACAAGPAVLLMDAAAEPAPGALAAALRRLADDPGIGAVGGMVLRPDGLLREAGGELRASGTRLSLQGTPPTAPAAAFARDVDFCTGAFLLVRSALLGELGGFDPVFAATGGEDAALCRRIAGAGRRVVYAPGVVVQLTSEEPWRPPPSGSIAAPAARQGRRVLFIDDTVPLRGIGSGFVRSNDVVRALAALGWAVTVFPLAPARLGPASVAADLPDTVELVPARRADGLEGFLRNRPDGFDAVWIARTHNLDGVHAVLDRVWGGRYPIAAGVARDPRPDPPPQEGAGRPRPRIILDTEAVASRREAARARLRGEKFDEEAAEARELCHAALCDRVVTVSEAEAAVLRARGPALVSVVGHALEPRPTPAVFAERAGLLFLGAIHEVDSPNHDSLCWFIEAVLPLIERELGWETRLTVAGYLGPGVDLRSWHDHPRVTLLGPVADPAALYGSHRVFVAPTRFAAGLPYKLHEAAAFGLPAVATGLLRGLLGWSHEVDLLAADEADPGGFAACVVRLYRDAGLWGRIRAAALARVATETDRGRFTQAVREVLEGP